MEEIGQPRTALVAGAALLVAALGCAWAWPFAIDDAWISVRYARHLAMGAGYVWNVGGASTDGVTPLPWAFLLAPLAHADAFVVLERAKLLGAFLWAMAMLAWGAAVGRADAKGWVKWAAVGLLAIDVPAAAHAVSGMETPVATLLATLAVTLRRRPRTAALLAGLAAAFRPELVVWAVVVSVGLALVRGMRPVYRAWDAATLAALPFALCALVRVRVFGHPAPLSLLAKPSDLAHGLSYAGAAALVTLAPILLMSFWALARERGPGVALAVAAAAHFAVLVVVGGDWMPYARLAVPIVPSMLLAFVYVAPYARTGATAARVGLAVVLGLYLFPRNVRALVRAGEDRAAMMMEAAPLLAGASRLAALDIGWVSAVSEGTILDLAGVTDPEIAVLPGGHTSKRVDAALLLAHDPDVVLFYSDALPKALADVTFEAFPRVVEARLARSELFQAKLAPVAFVRLGRAGAGYVVFRQTRGGPGAFLADPLER